MPKIAASKSPETPLKISRTKLELFMRCPRCFYLDVRLGVKQPPGYPFNLNSAVDTLLKKEFDMHRVQRKRHPLMEKYGIDAIPFAHPELDRWRDNFFGVRYLHEATNTLVFGAVDDIWVSPKGVLHVVDYKATSKAGPVSIDAEWQDAYKRQMEVYQWLLQQNGFSVSDTGYFVYCNGRRDRHAFDGKLEFDVVILPYRGSARWVEDAIVRARKCLALSKMPEAGAACEYCVYRAKARGVESV